MACDGCPPFVPCASLVATDDYDDGDQDDTRSWVGQLGLPGTAGPVGLTFSPGLSASPPFSVPVAQVQDHGLQQTSTFYSVEIPPGTVEARLSGSVRAFCGPTSAEAPDLLAEGWEIIRGGWGDSEPTSLNPGGTVLASGSLDFQSPAVDIGAFDTGRFAVSGGNFQFYVRFASVPMIAPIPGHPEYGGGFYTFTLRSEFTPWELEFFDCVSTPRSNQPVLDELVGLGDGVTTAFTTAFPYEWHSLEVDVATIHAEHDPTDPATGAFELPDPPPPGAPIRATYRAAGA